MAFRDGEVVTSIDDHVTSELPFEVDPNCQIDQTFLDALEERMGCMLFDAFGHYDITGKYAGVRYHYREGARWDYWGNRVRFRTAEDAILFKLSWIAP